MKTLKLTLHKAAFDVTGTKEKLYEFRKPSKWILSRLRDKNGKDKEYDFVEFTNGYGKDKPKFLCPFLGWVCSAQSSTKEYSNGLVVEIDINDVIIKLGEREA